MFWLSIPLYNKICYLRLCLDKNLDCLWWLYEVRRNENEFCEISSLAVWHLHVLCVAVDSAGRLKCWTNFCSKCSNCQPSFQLLNLVHIHDARFSASIAVFSSQTEFIISWIKGKEFLPFCLWKLCRIILALLCPLSYCWKLSAPFGIQQIDGRNCRSAYERHDVLKSHLYYSRKKSYCGKRNCSLSSQGPGLLILSNYPLIFLKNSSICHRDWHQHITVTSWYLSHMDGSRMRPEA